MLHAAVRMCYMEWCCMVPHGSGAACCGATWSGEVSGEACKWCCMLYGVVLHGEACNMEWCMDLALRGGHIEIHIDSISNLHSR